MSDRPRILSLGAAYLPSAILALLAGMTCAADAPLAPPQPSATPPPPGPPQSPAPPPAADPAAPAQQRTWPADAEPLDDPNVPVSGELSPNFDLINRDPSNWLGIPPDKELLNLIRDPLKALDEKYGLLFSGAYTMLFQQSIGQGAVNGAAGDLDLFARWIALGRGTKDTGTFYFAAEYRHGLESNTPAEIGGEIGSLLGTTNGFNDRGWSVKDAYWVQRLFDDRVRFGLGRVDSENLVGGYKLQSANTSFLNKAFSTNPTIAFPGSGMGAALSLKPVEWFYVAAGAANAYGKTTTIDIDELFDEWRLFKWVEVGYTPKIEGLGEGRYRVAAWHMDSRELTDQPSDGGISFIVDQEIGENISLFARYGYADGSLTKVRQLAEGGGAYEGLFGSSSDLTGLAFAWAEPYADVRNEMVLEAFHRFQLTGRIQLTLGIQLILDPSNNPTVDALGVFSARFRITF